MPESPDIPEAAALNRWGEITFSLALVCAIIIFASGGSIMFMYGPQIDAWFWWFMVPPVIISGAVVRAVLRAAGDVVRQLHRIADAQDPRGVPPWPPMPAQLSGDEPPPVPRG